MARSYATSSDYVRLASLAISSSPATIAGWFYFTSTPSYGTVGIIAANDGIWVKSTGKMAYYTPSANLDPASLTVNANAWNHSALVANGSNSQGYLNGAADGATIGNGTGGFGTGAFSTGTDTASENLVGRTADVAVWSVALTLAEIQALNAGARPGTIRPNSLMLWWPLDGLQSPEPDLSGSARNGTVNGSAALAAGPPVMQFTPRWPQFNAVAAAASGIKFRKTLSTIGGRVGTRQIQGWAN